MKKLVNKINLINRESAADILEAKSQMSIATDAQIVFAAASRMVRLLAAIDAAPVLHGRWVPSESPAHLTVIKCSECNTMYQRRWKAYCNFCPNCGAKMDLEG